MSQEKTQKNHHIDSADLESYITLTKASDKKHSFTDWMSLQSQIYVEGIHNLNSVLKKDKPPSIDEIRQNNEKELLRDLEQASKRHDFEGKIPKFKQEFYDELAKPAGERSKEYKKFVQACADKFNPDNHMVEMVAAKALIALDKQGAKVDDVKKAFNENMQQYKSKQSEQSRLDHDRSYILYKGPEGKIMHLSVDELMSSEEVGLTGEQKEFIQTSWQQGSFNCGWTVAFGHAYKSDDDLIYAGEINRTHILIDASGDSIKFSNRLEVAFTNMANPGTGKQGVFEASVTVDVTELKGDSFTPGAGSAKPQISFDITELSETVALDIPKGLTTSSPNISVSEQIKTEAEQIKEYYTSKYLDNIKNNRNKDKAWKSIIAIKGTTKAAAYFVEQLDVADIKELSLEQVAFIAKECSPNMQNIPAINDNKKQVLLDKFEQLKEQYINDFNNAQDNTSKNEAWSNIEAIMDSKDQASINASRYIMENADTDKLSLDDIEKIAKNLKDPKAETQQDKIQRNYADIVQTAENNQQHNANYPSESPLDTLQKADKETQSNLKENPVDFVQDKMKNSQTQKIIEQNKAEYQKVMGILDKLGSDDKTKEKFAEAQLDRYLQVQTTSSLDTKELGRIKSGMVDIMSPLCKNETEKNNLEKNAEKIIRACASQEGKNMSFAQRWENFKDTVSDIPNFLMGRKSKAQQIIDDHPEIKQSISRHMKNNPEQPGKTNQQQRKSRNNNGKGGRVR